MTKAEAAELEKLFQKQSEDKLTEGDTRHLSRRAAKRAAEHEARLTVIERELEETIEVARGSVAAGITAGITAVMMLGVIVFFGVRRWNSRGS
jgi:hypothetical protein